MIGVGLRRTVGVGGAIGLSACTLITGSADLATRPESASQLPGAGDGAVPSDPTRPTGPTGPILDAASDAEGGSLTDTSPGPPWCSLQMPAPRRCFDFEQSSLGGAPPSLSQGNLAVEQGSLRASMNASSPGFAYVSVPLDGGAILTSLRWSFSVRLDGLVPGMTVEFMEVALGPVGTIRCSIQPSVFNTDLAVNEFCQGGSGGNLQRNHTVLGVGPMSTGWYRFEIAMNLVNRTLSAKVTRPDSVSNTLAVTLADLFERAPGDLRIGLTWSAGSNPGHVVRLDNVTADWD